MANILCMHSEVSASSLSPKWILAALTEHISYTYLLHSLAVLNFFGFITLFLVFNTLLLCLMFNTFFCV